ncbi:arylsulfatase J-like protein [Leptotrombidium deliense]|uniref:Arylsulfatase J-like protein n=1 Tax=Leptotrombidium deliense TaxID=299467 RepID=A0A443RYA1_9ACAR|nr:arylsulfatase J-like protein [Leptotrombidium deliense]
MKRNPNYKVLDEKKVDCGEKPADASTNCKANIEHCLFNIDEDPCEYNNLAHNYPDIVQKLWNKLVEYNETAMPMENKPLDPCGNPKLHGGIFTNWQDIENLQEICKQTAENNQL